MDTQSARQHRIAVGVDGSNVSKKAFETALHFAHQAGSKVLCIHVHDPSKAYLPAHLTAKHIEHEYSNACSAHHLGNAGAISTLMHHDVPAYVRCNSAGLLCCSACPACSGRADGPRLLQQYRTVVSTAPSAEVHLVERRTGQSTCAALAEAAKHYNIDVLFVGSFGCKKGSADQVHIDVLGSVADASLRKCAADVCVVKSTSYEPAKSAKILVPVDLSEKSGYAFKKALHVLARKQDHISVVTWQSRHRLAKVQSQADLQHSPSSGSSRDTATVITDDMMAPYEQALQQWGGSYDVEVVTLDCAISIAAGILERAHSSQADYIVLGIAGNDDRDIGSVTENVVQGARCTTFAIKNPHF